MKLRLKKDIVIRAGTIFNTAPDRIDLDSSSHVEATFRVGRSRDTYGTIIYDVGQPGSPEHKQVSRYFEKLAPKPNL